MSFLSSIIGEGVAAPVEAVGGIIDKLFTSDEERLDKQAILQRLAQEPSLAQVELNKVEAQHRTIFVAGWRPFIGWVCGAALGWKFIGFDLAAWACTMFNLNNVSPPQFVGSEMLMELVIGMLGLSGLRTWEKIQGRSK